MRISTGWIRARHVSLLCLSILALAAATCNMPDQVTQESPPGTQAATEPFPLETETEPPTVIVPTQTEEAQEPEIEIAPETYTIAVIVDQSSEPVTREQAQVLIDEASGIFQERTGFSIMMVDFIEMMPEQAEQRSDLPARYLHSNPGIIPDGIVMFSFGNNNQAQLYGGYASSLHGPSGASSHFPINGDDTLITVSTIDFSHRYAICGYDPENSYDLISDVSLGGQCRNQPGTPCVERFGYSMCSNAVDDLYASSPTYMAASSIVHEIAHPYGRHGNGDHYGTQECQAEMGWDASTWTYKLEDAQDYVGMCPYVYNLIVESYQP